MALDIRLPIGLLFFIIGALLSVYGLFSDQTIYERSLDINVNFWWGTAMLLFGIIMILFSRQKPGKPPREDV